MRAPRPLFTMLIASLLLGCRATAPAPTADRSTPGGEPIEVVVTNMNWATIEVYVVAAGQSSWLGMVETGRMVALKLPARFLSSPDLYLSVQTIGSRQTWSTDLLVLTEGVTLELTVENNLPLSHYVLYQ